MFSNNKKMALAELAGLAGLTVLTANIENS
jgi:hypothetical protein